MCGIAGSINYKFSNDGVISSMYHRGPDDQNNYEFGNVQFLHLRLAILDIGGGKQPMHLDDKYTIIFNGEIYNHRDVRNKFQLHGNTSSDTETLLLLYEKFGTDFLQYLDGMFAFVIHDKINNQLFIARDRAGKKPFYYFFDEKKFVFASELNGLKSMLPLEIEYKNFYHYLRLGSFYGRFTPYKNVSELQAGSFITIDCNTLSLKEKKWWNIHDFYLQQNNESFEEILNKTDHYLHQSVKRRIESSDLEVGCFLSGGIDSGLVTSIASEYNSKLKTFTVSFEGEYNEAPLAKLVAEKYKTQHTEINISFAHLKNDVEKILSNYGEPFFDSSAIPSYYVSKEARKYVTVVLNGDGADELFGGYRRYVPFCRHDFFKENIVVKGSASLIKNVINKSDSKRSVHDYIYRLASLASKSSVEVYLSAGVDIFEDYEKNILAQFDYLEPIRKDFDVIARSNLSGLKKIMNLDFDTNLFCDLLVKMDIATMANSQEGRSPFLSKELLEYIPPIKYSYKINGTTTKYILRTLAKKYLPDVLIDQPKRGFEIPLKKWVDKELSDIISDYLLSPGCLYSNFVKEKFVKDLLSKKIMVASEKRAKILWTLLAMEIWYKKVYQ